MQFYFHTWLEAICTTPALLRSFTEDMENRIKQFQQEGLKWIEEDNLTKAQMALGKAKAFESLLYSIQSTIREEVQRDEYIQKTNPGGSKAGGTRKAR